MLEITKGSVAKVKAEMTQWKKSKEQELRAIKKEHKAKKIHSQDRIITAEKVVRMYLPSRVLPVKVEGIIVDYKLYEAFIKKLKRTPFTVSVDEYKLTISCKTGPNTSGKLELFDMSKWYGEMRHIPTAILKDDAYV